MKTIYNIIITIILMAIILTVYFKIDIITEYIKDFFVTEKNVILKEPNNYKRDYEYISIKASTDFIPLNKFDIMNVYYSILNNGWNEFTFYCPSEYENCVDDVNTIANDNNLINKVNGYVNPFNSFNTINTTISSTGEIMVEIDKNYSENQIKMVNDRVDSIIEELNLNKIESNIDKITAIQNYIIKNVIYDEERANSEESAYLSNSAYGALIQGYGVCSGYSDAMALFLDKLNIPNFKITSNNHVWNMVFIDNEWKHLDVTWNDNEKAVYNNNYFLIDTETLKELDPDEHKYDTSFYLEAL